MVNSGFLTRATTNFCSYPSDSLILCTGLSANQPVLLTIISLYTCPSFSWGEPIIERIKNKYIQCEAVGTTQYYCNNSVYAEAFRSELLSQHEHRDQNMFAIN